MISCPQEHPNKYEKSGEILRRTPKISFCVSMLNCFISSKYQFSKSKLNDTKNYLDNFNDGHAWLSLIIKCPFSWNNRETLWHRVRGDTFRRWIDKHKDNSEHFPLFALQLSFREEVSKRWLPTFGIVNSLSSAAVISGKNYDNYSQSVHIPAMFARHRG